MRIRNYFIIVLFIIAMTGGAEAATVETNDTIELTILDWSKNATVDKFDPNLGTLINITVTAEMDSSGSVQFDNEGGMARTFDVNISTDATMDLPSGTSLSASLLLLPTTSVFLTADTEVGPPDYIGTDAQSYPSLFNISTDFTITSDPDDLTNFTASYSGEKINLTVVSFGNMYFTGGTNVAYQIATFAEANVTVVYTYIPYASIGDYVWHDMDADGVQDSGESGIPDVNVTLYNCSDVEIAETKTNASGGYNFTQLVPDDYYVEFELPPGYNFSPDNQTDEANDSDANPTTGKTECTTLDPDEDDMTWDAGMYQNASIGDYVWGDTDKNGTQDGGETGIPGVTVHLMDCSGTILETNITDSNGKYLFTDLTPGNYKIHFIALLGYSFTLQDQGSDDTDSDANATGHTACTVLESGEDDITWDAGLVEYNPDIMIIKYTNGDDANCPTGPLIATGDTVTWTYYVNNTGNIRLDIVNVTDNQSVSVSCPKPALDPNENMTCSATGQAVPGQYANIGNVSGYNETFEQTVYDDDPSHYYGVNVTIHLEKYTNGVDADDPTGPVLNESDPVQWNYTVTNTGDVNLTGVSVEDDQGVTVTCPKGTLNVSESMICSARGTAVVGQYANIGNATGCNETLGKCVSDTDPSHYLVKVPGPGTGTPGYWKNHPEAWPVDNITIGNDSNNETYEKDCAIELMGMGEKGDKRFTLFRALVAAKLNVLVGNDDSCIADNISAADDWFADSTLLECTYDKDSKVKANSDAWKEAEPIYERLDLYNNGGLCCAASRDTSDLSITKTVSDDAPLPSDTVVFTLTVQNMGPANATGVYVDDTLEFNLTFNSSTNCTNTTQDVYCYIGDLLRYETRTLTFSADVNSTISSLTEIENTANVSGTDTYEWGPDWECDRRLNNQDNVTITVTPP